MANNRTMEETLQTPTEGYGDAIVVPHILAENFEIRTGLLSLIQANQFHRFESNNPHDHIRSFNRITSTFKFRDVPNDAIKLMIFPYPLEEAAKICNVLTVCVTMGTYNQGSTGFLPQVATNYRANPPGFPPVQNNENCFNQNQNQSYNQNRGNNYQTLIQHPQVELTNEFSKYKQITETSIRAMQNQIDNFKAGLKNKIHSLIQNQINNVKNELRSDISNQTNELRNMMASYFQMNTASTSGSGSLPSNTVPNPRADLKAITTQSGITLDGPSVSSSSGRLRTRDNNGSEKLFDLDTTPVNENCSTVILKKLLEKLGDPDKFLIPCDFPELDECLAMEDLGASLNLMHLSIWRKLSLPELTSTQMILELADRSTTRPASIAEDVFVKVGKFHFPTHFVVIDYVVEPRVPLILRRPFLRTGRALIDVYGEELTLRVDDEAITFNVGQTSKYSYKDAESINLIDVIDVDCKEYVQEVLGFSDNSKSCSPTPASDPIISSFSTSFTPFEGSDFILEEIDTFLQTLDELFDLDDDHYDTERDILYLEKLLNEDPSSNLPPMKTEDLKQVDASMTKPSIEEPSDLELKELPSHLEYAFLEGTDNLPIIIYKELKDEEKSALLKVLNKG
uniref:Reverse transcriptase domain-containing protein n=1 Tax=Tanacetum cinerariifolium TaxID=118510 RepID=A0A6L2MJJ2_TANCI|nr:reverse transcriptase domain-containing protein [Tanacetum cinerariifolium]